MSQFSDRGSFPNAIHSHKEHDSQAIFKVNLLIVLAIFFVEIHQFFNDHATQGIRFLGIFQTGFIAELFCQIRSDLDPYVTHNQEFF